MMETGSPRAFWREIAEYPLFVLKMYLYPRGMVRSLDFGSRPVLGRTAFYLLATLAILVFAFSDNRQLSDQAKPSLSTFKGIVMRAHDRSWDDWISPVYEPLNIEHGEAKRLWDTLLTTGFLTYTMFAALLGFGVVARIRMAYAHLGWEQALGTAMLSAIAAIPCFALSIVPFMELMICRHCIVRAVLFILLNVTGWFFMGYFTLADFGERPASVAGQCLKSVGYGLAQYIAAYIVFLVIIACIIPA